MLQIIYSNKVNKILNNSLYMINIHGFSIEYKTCYNIFLTITYLRKV